MYVKRQTFGRRPVCWSVLTIAFTPAQAKSTYPHVDIIAGNIVTRAQVRLQAMSTAFVADAVGHRSIRLPAGA